MPRDGYHTNVYPACPWHHRDCFANDCGCCRVLNDCHFEGRVNCPFYKPRSKAEKDFKKYGGMLDVTGYTPTEKMPELYGQAGDY